jgi:hypothetical protein
MPGGMTGSLETSGPPCLELDTYLTTYYKIQRCETRSNLAESWNAVAQKELFFLLMLVVVAVAMAVNQMNYCLILGKRFMSQ